MSGKEDTTPVGTYPEGASPYGLLDMAGNVWEWTRSDYKGYPYDPKDGRENLEAERYCVLRGGAFGSYASGVRCASRDWDAPYTQWNQVGFRVMLASSSPLDSGGSNE
jgi:formylglycine-generating enzyme required for sulfatase activity